MKQSNGKLLSIFVSAVLAAALIAYGAYKAMPRLIRFSGQPPANKEVFVIAQYVSTGNAGNLVAMEQAIGNRVASSLRKKGFDVRRTFSMAEMLLDYSSGPSALLQAFALHRRDDARILWVTLLAEPGGRAGTVQTSFAFLDLYTWDFAQARGKGCPAPSRVLWITEAPPVSSPIEAATAELDTRFEAHLGAYASQYDRALGTQVEKAQK